MKYMLDTNICIYIIKEKPRKVLNRLQKTKVSDVCISSITLSELEYGVQKSSHKEQNKIALTEFAAPLEVVDYNDLAAKEYGEIRASLEQVGRTLGALDTLIAAHARALKVTLVTNNEREFKRVADLKLENWVK
ncbi:MAG: type II toxin-antitoxin system tRNA(fMet)-specific endonuclease VapC [Planctomycetota bacterium]|jgi:tRNA(fMet)-specific endonuclease VapC